MSDSSRAQLRYVEESTWGETPASAMTDLRMVSESLNYEISNVTSQEIRSDRQTDDLIQTSYENTGGFNFELSYATFDPFIESALFSSFSAGFSFVDQDIAADSLDNSFNLGGTDVVTDFTAEGIIVGMWLKVGGFTDPANNGLCRVVSVTPTKLVVEGLTLVTEAAGAAIAMANGGLIRNGVTEKSFTLEKEFSDITQFISFTGMIANTMEISASAQEILTGSFEFIGKNAAITQTSVGTGPSNPSNINPVLDAGNNVGTIRENGSSLLECLIQSITVSLNNNLRGQGAVACIGNADISAGTVAIEGEINAYFVNEVLYQKYIDGTETSIDFALTDDLGNIYVITLPRVKFSSGEIVVGGINQDVLATMGYTAIRDEVTNCMIQIDRINA